MASSSTKDKHCTLKDGKILEDFHCLLNQVDEKSDKFYVLQLLQNSKGYFVWTRWGRNGTKGQSKLEGPVEKLAAIKNFKQKFQDKTKNKWDDRNGFKPVKGKYTLVVDTAQSTSNSASSSSTKDEHCTLKDGKILEDFHCLLNQVDGKSDKFYVLQLLQNSKGYFVWTRWGRNGTKGQSKLEGPVEKLAAIKNFKQKFQDKTKNKWDDSNGFKPVKGKYTLVVDTAQSTSDNSQQKKANLLAGLEAEKPSFPDTVVSGINLHADVLYQIMIHLSTKDVLKCMQVCTFWKTVLSEKYFWKKYIYHHFDLTLKTSFDSNYASGPIAEWSNPEKWYCYYEDEDDKYVMRPFPSMWECDVVHPSGLDPMAGDVKSLQGFSRSLEILAYMKKGIKKFDLSCGRECSGSEGEHDIGYVLFPWNEEKLPEARIILDEIFHFHPEILEGYSEGSDEEIWKNDKLYYHLPNENDEDDEEEEHDVEEKPCLNRILGFGWSYDGENPQQVDQFYSWLQSIMVPTITVYAGSDKLNPVGVFFLTKLAPGWVGGALTAVIYT